MSSPELVRKPASATNGGELDSSITQVIPGAKTFSGAVAVSGNLSASGAIAFDPTLLTDVQATMMGLKVYTIGTTYNSVAITFTNAASPVITTNKSALIPYQMQDGTWRLKFNIKGTFASSVPATTDITIDLSGVVVANPNGDQAIAVAGAAGSVLYPNVYTTGATIRFNIAFSTANTVVDFSGDIALASKPTWAY